MEDAQIAQNPPAKNSQRTWAMFCHLSALVMLLGIPLGNIIAPLIIWLIKKDNMSLVDEAGKEALNFQISMTIYSLIAFALCFLFIGFLLIFPLVLLNVVLVIVASVKISNNESYQYPFTIRMIK